MNAFSGRTVSEFEIDLRKRIKDAIFLISGYQLEQIVGGNGEPAAIQNLIEQFTVSPPVIQTDKKQRSHREVLKANGPVQYFTLYIPFEGDGDIINITPETKTFYLTNQPSICIDGSNLTFEILDNGSGHEVLERQIQEIVNRIVNDNEKLGAELEKLNCRMRTFIKYEFDNYKATVLSHAKTRKCLNIPIRQRENPPSVVKPVKQVKKIEMPVLIKPNTPEWYTVEPSIYNAILQIMFEMGSTMEKYPSTFRNKIDDDERNKGENALRDIFLVILQPHFEFSATGETFNRLGKTDIMIRWKEKNVFIAECKFWKGSKLLEETIDQLLGYITWRDTKTAMIWFVDNNDMKTVIDALKTEIPKHKFYCKTLPETAWLNYEFYMTAEKQDKFSLAVLAFHFPKAEATKPKRKARRKKSLTKAS